MRFINDFCQQQNLPGYYPNLATQYFLPLADELAHSCKPNSRPLLIGINGSQGSGKSTLAALLSQLLTQIHGLRVCNLSIDDFYHTQMTRRHLAEEIHPLLAIRGVPGTHDTVLLQQTLNKLSRFGHDQVCIPRFNKAIDDRHPIEQQETIQPPVDIILLEGWCVGVTPQEVSELIEPCNALEANEDIDGSWRQFVNEAIRETLLPIFHGFDHLIMLKAPSFDCVFAWRKIQEDKLRQSLPPEADPSSLMDAAALARFIQHYQRLTEHMLAQLPNQADIVFHLSESHEITARQNNR